MRLIRSFLVGVVLLMCGVSSTLAQEYHVYVASESDDEVAHVRFDGETAAVASTVAVGRLPTETEGAHGMAVSPDGDHWFVSIAHGKPYGRVVKYETGSNRKVGAAQVGMFPATMALSKITGLLYVVNFNLHGPMEPSTVSVVDPSTMTEVDQVETGPMPHGSRLSPDGQRQYSVAMMSGTLYELNAATLRVTRTLSTGDDRSKPTWVQPHPTKPLAYVAHNGADEVVEVNLNDWTIDRRFATGTGTKPYNLDVTPNGQHLVVTYKGSGETGIWDLASGEAVARLPNSRPVSHGVVVSPDSRYAFVTAEGVGGEPGAVDMFDLTARKRVASVDVGKQAGGIAFWKMAEDAPASMP
jgi:DNA-binding beta-propeller fold protein YncE